MLDGFKVVVDKVVVDLKLVEVLSKVKDLYVWFVLVF